MNTISSLDKRKKLIGFSLSFLLAVTLAGFLLSALWYNDGKPSKIAYAATAGIQSSARKDLVTKNLALINTRAKALQDVDKQYAGLAVIPGNKSQLDDINILMRSRERDLRILLDSISLRTMVEANDHQQQILSDIIAAYRSFLDCHRLITSINNASGSNDSNLITGDISNAEKSKLK